jgi:hypothetical protein
VRALSHNRGVQVLGRARPRGHASQSISILHNGRRVASVTAAGYFLKSVRRASSGKWQLRWTFNGVTYSSRVASALPDPPVSAR